MNKVAMTERLKLGDIETFGDAIDPILSYNAMLNALQTTRIPILTYIKDAALFSKALENTPGLVSLSWVL